MGYFSNCVTFSEYLNFNKKNDNKTVARLARQVKNMRFSAKFLNVFSLMKLTWSWSRTFAKCTCEENMKVFAPISLKDPKHS